MTISSAFIGCLPQAACRAKPPSDSKAALEYNDANGEKLKEYCCLDVSLIGPMKIQRES